MRPGEGGTRGDGTLSLLGFVVACSRGAGKGELRGGHSGGGGGGCALRAENEKRTANEQKHHKK